MPAVQNLVPCLWFDGQGKDAAEFYTSIFPNSKIISGVRYPEAGREIHGQEPGSQMVVEFELDGQRFVALNGGPQFKFNEAVSFQILCDSQQEIDRYWEKLSAGGDPRAQQCGWLKDRFGLSWQVIPRKMGELMGGGDPGRANRVMSALLPMKKIDLAALEKAARG